MIHDASAIMGGLGIDVIPFTGLLALALATLETPGQMMCLHLAATLSILGFYAGYGRKAFLGALGACAACSSRTGRGADP